MKTMKERAYSYAPERKYDSDITMPDYEVADIRREAFIAGAESEHKELTRWNSPDKPPKRGISVLIRCNAYPGIDYYVGYWSGVCFYTSLKDMRISNVIGWREIHEKL